MVAKCVALDVDQLVLIAPATHVLLFGALVGFSVINCALIALQFHDCHLP